MATLTATELPVTPVTGSVSWGVGSALVEPVACYEVGGPDVGAAGAGLTAEADEGEPADSDEVMGLDWGAERPATPPGYAAVRDEVLAERRAAAVQEGCVTPEAAAAAELSVALPDGRRARLGDLVYAGRELLGVLTGVSFKLRFAAAERSIFEVAGERSYDIIPSPRLWEIRFHCHRPAALYNSNTPGPGTETPVASAVPAQATGAETPVPACANEEDGVIFTSSAAAAGATAVGHLAAIEAATVAAVQDNAGGLGAFSDAEFAGTTTAQVTPAVVAANVAAYTASSTGVRFRSTRRVRMGRDETWGAAGWTDCVDYADGASWCTAYQAVSTTATSGYSQYVVCDGDTVTYTTTGSQARGRFRGEAATFHVYHTTHRAAAVVEPADPDAVVRAMMRARSAPAVVQRGSDRQSPAASADPREGRARDTLALLLGRDSYRRFLRDGFVYARGPSGKSYQIFPGHGITRVYEGGRQVERLCVVLSGAHTPLDSLIVRFIMVQHEEEKFRALAVAHRVTTTTKSRVSRQPEAVCLADLFKKLKKQAG